VIRSWLLAVVLAGCTHGKAELQFVSVKQDDLVIGVEVSGELEAVDSLDVKPPALPNVWDFKIASLATEGADLKAGDPVVAFDTSSLTHELETMQNEADAAQKKLDKKRNDAALARRDEELKIAEAEAALRKASLKTNVATELVASVEQHVVELDEQAAKLELERAKHRAETARRSDDGEIENLVEHHTYATRRVDELQANLKKMNVIAPRAGTVVLPTNWRGEKKKVGDSTWRMEACVQIVGLGKMIGKGEIDEVDVARVAEHQPVSLRLDALPDVQLHGTVTVIAKSVQAKSNTDPSKMVKLTIALESSASTPLRPGMRFRGDVETERLTKVVQVPAEAVFVTADGPVAYREHAGGVERVRLTLGRRSATAIEVKAGLAPGDRVSRIDPERGAP
jgi:HlyD family secretion protein